MAPAVAAAQVAYHPAVSPTPGLQVASAHSSGGKADGPGAIMFYASISLLGFSVIFVIWYYVVKAVKEGGKRRRKVAAKVKGRGWGRVDEKSGHGQTTWWVSVREFWDRTVVGRGTNEPSTPRLDEPAIEQWAETYLRHIRHAEDIAAGLPNVVHRSTPPPMRTPPPLYSAVCVPAPSVATFGRVGDLKHSQAQLVCVSPMSPTTPPSARMARHARSPLSNCQWTNHDQGQTQSQRQAQFYVEGDPEADITDILNCYRADASLSMEFDSDGFHRTPETSMSASIHGLGVDTSNDTDGDGEGSIPKIVIEGPPPYALEADIADQSLMAEEGWVDERLLTIPEPRTRPCAPKVSLGRSMVRVERLAVREKDERGGSFVQRFTRGGLFDLAGLTAKSKNRAKAKQSHVAVRRR